MGGAGRRSRFAGLARFQRQHKTGGRLRAAIQRAAQARALVGVFQRHGERIDIHRQPRLGAEQQQRVFVGLNH